MIFLPGPRDTEVDPLRDLLSELRDMDDSRGLELVCTTKVKPGTFLIVGRDHNVKADVCKTCTRCDYWATVNPVPGHNKRGEVMEAV